MFWLFFMSSGVSFWPYAHIVKFSNQEDVFIKEVRRAVLRESAQSARDAENDILFRTLREFGAKLSEPASIDTQILWDAHEHIKRHCETASDPHYRRMMEAIKNSLQYKHTFTMPMAVANLSVSFTWTIIWCTGVSLVPPQFWNALTLSSVGVILVSLGIGCVALLALRAEKQPDDDNFGEEFSQDAATPLMDQPEANQKKGAKARRRGSALPPLDLLVLAEADAMVL